MHWPYRKCPGQTLTLFHPLLEPAPTTEHAQYILPFPEMSCSRQCTWNIYSASERPLLKWMNEIKGMNEWMHGWSVSVKVGFGDSNILAVCLRQGILNTSITFTGEPVKYHNKTVKDLDCTWFSQRYNRPSVCPQSTQTWQQKNTVRVKFTLIFLQFHQLQWTELS